MEDLRIAYALPGGRMPSTLKAYREGTHRLVQPEETLERIKPFLRVMGITRIANVTGLDSIGIPVVMVCRPNSRSVSVSQGKGVNIAAAKASGVMESVESYHAEHITLPLKLASAEELRYTHRIADTDRLPRLSDSQFTPFVPILWIEGYDLLQGRPAWVPFESVHLNYALPLPSGHGCFVASSNGLASGNHHLEAISHATCELVERDAMTLWHQRDDDGQEETRIDLETVDDPIGRGLVARFERAGIEIGVWETTSDVGIPSFLCRIIQVGDPPYHSLRPATGMGCHPCREIALTRALTEAAQSRLTFISGARDDMPRIEYERFLDPETHGVWRQRMRRSQGRRDFREVTTWDVDSFEAEVSLELDRLAAVGITEAIVVDLTKPEFDIPVVRVVIPGLESSDHSPNYVLGARAEAALANFS